MKFLSRLKGILLSPKTEWRVIASEATSVNTLYTGYAMILLVLVPVTAFACSLLFFSRTGGNPEYGLAPEVILQPLLHYCLCLAVLFTQAKAIETIAPNTTTDTVAGLKLAVYASTPFWLTLVLRNLMIALNQPDISPWPAFSQTPLIFVLTLLPVLGALHSLYLLYLGLPPVVVCHKEKALGLALVIAGTSFAAYHIAVSIVQHGIMIVLFYLFFGTDTLSGFYQ